MNLISQSENTCLNFENTTETREPLSGLEEIVESEHFIIHYTQSGVDACSTDFANRASQYAEESYNLQCNVFGWQIPPGDGEAGGSFDKYDIYIKAIEGWGVTIREVPDGWTNNWASSYVQIRNNLDDDMLKITVAHEFNHVIQYGYSLKHEEYWFHENTATWVEDLVYDEPDLYLNWFDERPNAIDDPDSRIDNRSERGVKYSGALWPRLLAEWISPQVVIDSWARMGQSESTTIMEDIDFTLQNYSKTLSEALIEYAVWRYFTGSRNDNQHFSNASDLPMVPISKEFNTIDLPVIDSLYLSKGIGNLNYISLINEYDNLLIEFSEVATSKWAVAAIEDKFPSQSEVIYFNQSNQVIASSSSSNRVILLPVKLVSVGTIWGYYSAESYPTVSINFFNKINNNNAGGVLLLDGSDEIQSGDARELGELTTHEVETLNERFNNAKFNNWNNSNSRYFLSNDFTAEAGNDQTANFVDLELATISIKVDGFNLITQKDSIMFNDPWYVNEYGDQLGMGNFLTFSAPYVPTGKHGESNGGVFLDQDYNIPGNPYYSVSISPTQTINYNNRSHKIYFTGWAHNGKADFEDAELTTTPVVFTDGGAVVYANNKGSLMSSSTSALRGPSQRKIARTSDNNYHLLYESNGKIWYEINNGTSNEWSLHNLSFPNLYWEGEFPSVDANGDDLLVAYQKYNGSSTEIRAALFDSPTSTIVADVVVSTIPGDVEAKPVVAYNNDGKFVVTFITNTGILKYVNCQISGSSISVSNVGTIDEVGNVQNISIAGVKINGNDKYYLAFETGDDRIRFTTLTGFSYGTIHTPSNNSGYDTHWNPEVVISGSTVYVGFIGQRYEAGEEEPGPIQWKTNAFGGGGGSFGEWKERGLLRSFNGSSWSGIIKALGSDVDDVALNTAGSSVVFAYYTQTDGALGETYYTRGVQSGDGFNTIFNISDGGKSFMLSNANSIGDMKWVDVAVFADHLSMAEPPFSLKSGNINFSASKDGSSTDLAMIGREGVTTRDSVQFYFTFGEIIVDGVQVNFVELPDTMKEIKNSNQLNKFLVSEPFTLDDNSQFTYGVMCGVADSADIEVALEKNKYINFKVELIEDQIQKVLGVYDNVTFTSDSINYYSNKNYQVDTKGIGNKTVRLRLQVKDNFKQNYSIGNLLVEDSLMYKKGYNELNYKGELLVKDYDLVQNYPNPFNPTTTIKYQIPKSGHVKLRVYDILGREVTTLVNEYLEDGRYEAVFNANELSSGVYIYRLEVNDFITSKKMMLVK
ncbi:MAG: T9SS type A sorting domain-containing protein [Melioribacteraceae bacterium]|nr:MAG: T9SS type A sorting domain-containing protein [Melioribacteraceae bacterium]